MQYKYRLSREAEADIFNSYQWYEDKSAGLGEEFFYNVFLIRKIRFLKSRGK